MNKFSMDSFVRGMFAFGLVSWVSMASSFAQDGETQEQARARAYPPLSDSLERRPVVIWSDGTRMAGDLYYPKNRKPTDKLPVIVFANGTGEPSVSCLRVWVHSLQKKAMPFSPLIIEAGVKVTAS